MVNVPGRKAKGADRSGRRGEEGVAVPPTLPHHPHQLSLVTQDMDSKYTFLGKGGELLGVG